MDEQNKDQIKELWQEKLANIIPEDNENYAKIEELIKEETQKSKEEFEKCQTEREGFLAGWQRERADYMNFKKEMEQKLESIKDLVSEETLLDFLPILDSFYLALNSTPKDISENQWFLGIQAMAKQIDGVLKKEDIEYIESLGKPFNPEEHHALEMVENEDAEKSNTVAEELQRGYKLKNKVLRPSLVKVNK